MLDIMLVHTFTQAKKIWKCTRRGHVFVFCLYLSSQELQGADDSLTLIVIHIELKSIVSL